MTEYIIGYWEY